MSSGIKGIKLLNKDGAARLLLEAEENLAAENSANDVFAEKLIGRIRKLIPCEVALRENPDKKARLFDYNPLSPLRLRYTIDGWCPEIIIACYRILGTMVSLVFGLWFRVTA